MKQPALFLPLFLTSIVASQGFSPQEAASKMTVPDGFEVSLVASEPDVRQPVAIDFDDRGRLWVVQYLQYPNPAGLKRVEVDRWSRTTYDKVPEPPPHGPQGADRITILEDSDGDGRMDRAKDFVSGLNLASGFAFGQDGVFVLQVPYLLFYPDKNRDDVPDSDPEVLLTGFGMQDAHSVANSLAWGPDGWLYGLEGSTVSSNIRGIEFQQGVWRYHPLTHEFELFCEGGGNMWGLDFDSVGNLFASTNVGPALVLHGVQGAYYWKLFSKHGDLHNPHAYGYFEHVIEDNYRGGHVSVGGLFYHGGAFPPEYTGKFIAGNLLSHDVYVHEFKPLGSTFTVSDVGDLLLGNDKWFAPTDLAIGPDGAVYVTDWNDKRTAHPDPDAEWDRTNGRIYRIAAKGSQPVEGLDLSQKTSDQLVDLLVHPNEWYHRRARALLATRRDPSVYPRLRKQIFESGNDHPSLESLWTLAVSGGFEEGLALELLKHPLASIRFWTIRYLGNEKKVSDRIGNALLELAKTEPDVGVRSQLAASAKRIQAQFAIPLISILRTHEEDAKDPHLPLLAWWAVEAHAVSAREEVLSTFVNPESWSDPYSRETILPRLTRRYAAEASPEGDQACLRILDSAPGNTERIALAKSLDLGLQDRHKEIGKVGQGSLFTSVSETDAAPEREPSRSQQLSPELQQSLEALWSQNREDLELLSLVSRLGNGEALSLVRSRLADSGETDEARIELVRILGQTFTQEDEVLLLGILESSPSEDLSMALLGALRSTSTVATLDHLLAFYPQLSERAQSKLRDNFFAKPDAALVFLRRVERGEMAPEEVPVEQLRVIALHEDTVLDKLVKDLWGTVSRGTPEEKLAVMRRFNNDLNFAQGDPIAGQEIFTKTCAICHKFNGEGNEIGPDLTFSNRTDREFLLVSLVDPSSVIRKEYVPQIVETVDGGLYTGIVVEKAPGSLTLVGPNNERTTISNEDIESERESQVSLMPEGLPQGLTPDQLRDLFAYLQAVPTQAPH